MQLIKDGKALENLFREDDRKSQEILPALISKLVKASCNKNTETLFPHGSAIFTPGVDGMTSSINADCKYVPKGKTFWEFGTSKDNIKKIESDYKKREIDPNIKNKRRTNLVLVTSQILNTSKKIKLEDDYTAKKVFRKVIILDANDLIEWLDANIEVSIWLLKQFGRRIDEYEVRLLTDEWDFISKSTEPNLVTSLFLCGNQAEAERFIKNLRKSDDGTFSFSSNFYGRDFALFFIVSALIDTSDDSLIDRCIVVKSQDALYLVNSMCENKIVIVDCTIESNFSVPLVNNVYVFFDNPLFTTISLGITDRNNFTAILKNMDSPNIDPDKYSFLSNFNPISLRRILSNIPSIKAPRWAKEKEKYHMIPLMLLGEINMDSQLYIKTLEMLFGDDYDEFLCSLNYLSEINDPPVFKYGNIYRNGCRYECFDYVKVDTFLRVVLKTEEILTKMLFETHLFGQNVRIERTIINIIQGFIIIAEKNKNDQVHFDNYVDGILNSIVGDVTKTATIKDYLSRLTELSPVAFMRFLRNTIVDKKDYLIDFCSQKRTLPYGEPSENIVYLLYSLRHCLSNKDLAFEALEYLLDIYFTINNSKEAEKTVKEYLSPIASMTGVTAIPFLSKAKFFFDYINNKKIDNAKAEPIVRTFHSDGIDSIMITHSPTYRNNVPATFTCSYKDIFSASEMAFEWLMVNSKDMESHIEEMFHNIHRNPFEQMEGEFKRVIANVGSLSNDQKESIRINAITTKGNIIRFKSWNYLLNYIPLLDELIKTLEPKDLFEKYKYILTNDYFPLDNPPAEDARDIEKEDKLRIAKRESVVKELIDCYGQEAILRILSDYNDESYYIWVYIRKVTTDLFRDIDNMIKYKREKALRCYLSNTDVDLIKAIIDKYPDEDILFKTLPFNQDAINLINGNKKESVFWSNNFFYGEKTVRFADVFEKFLEFNPFGVIAEMAYRQDVDYDQGIRLLSKIADMINDKKMPETTHTHSDIYEIQELVKKMDAKYYTDELSICEFRLLSVLMGGLNDYPLGLKKYFWDNPTEFADLLISLNEKSGSLGDHSIGSKIYFNAYLTLGDGCFVPKEYLIQQNQKVEGWVQSMLSKCDFVKNEGASRLILNAVVGVLSACPKIPGQTVWPTIEVANALEKMGTLEGMSGHDVAVNFATSVLNRRGVRTITNGDAEFILSDNYLKNASTYEQTHPITYSAIKIISDDIKNGGYRDRANYDLDIY